MFIVSSCLSAAGRGRLRHLDLTTARGTSRCRCENLSIESDQFSKRPRLERTPSRSERRFGIRNLGDVAKPRRFDMREERLKEPESSFAASGGRVPSRTEPRFDEGTDQPRPDGALVIDPISSRRPALIPCAVSGFSGSEGPESQGRQQASLDFVDDPPRAFSLHERDRKAADREDLVRPKAVIASARDVVDIDDVCQVTRGRRSRIDR